MSIASTNAVPPPPTAVSAGPGTYGQILKSTALVGGSSVVNIAIGIVRTKAMAILLGPAGFGLFGLYGSIADLAQSIAGMGVNSSGVRQIAEAAGSGNTDRIARTTLVLRRTSILLGVLGAVLLVVFSSQVSTLTFGDNAHAGAISLLSIAVFFRLISAGQGALIQGMRRIFDLAKMGVLGALSGTVVGIPIVYFLREDGVVPSLIAVAATLVATSWWYSRKIHVETPSLTASQFGREAVGTLKLGFAFMASGLMMMGGTYLVRIIVLRRLGIDATGLYQSAWTLGGLYVGFILQAMAADFYPRLTAVSSNNAACNRIVNEQARIGLLLGGPGVMATLTLAPLIITFFYSVKFGAALGLLRWMCLGTALRVITWPMGFTLLAKGRPALMFSTELAWTAVYVSLAWLFVKSLGLNGAGIAFFCSYLFHGFLMYPIVHRLSGFRWSRENKQTALRFLGLIAVVFWMPYSLATNLAACLSGLLTVASGVYSLRVLLTLVPLERLPVACRKVALKMGFPATGSGTADFSSRAPL